MTDWMTAILWLAKLGAVAGFVVIVAVVLLALAEWQDRDVEKED